MPEPTCSTCRWWERLYEESEARHAFGECRIRSVPADNFPERLAVEWCGEHFTKPAAKT